MAPPVLVIFHLRLVTFLSSFPLCKKTSKEQFNQSSTEKSEYYQGPCKSKRCSIFRICSKILQEESIATESHTRVKNMFVKTFTGIDLRLTQQKKYTACGHSNTMNIDLFPGGRFFYRYFSDLRYF